MRRPFAGSRGSDCRAESDGKIAVVGVDATREAVRAVEAGRLSADLATHPEVLGRSAVEAALKAARANLSKNASTGARNW